MTIAQHLAKHLRDVHMGGNWTAVNLKDAVSGLAWEDAIAKVPSFNTIAVLVYHMNYYVCAVKNVLEGNPLDAHDRFSFDLPPIGSAADWELLQEKAFADAEATAQLAEKLSDDQLHQPFDEGKYGNYYRNLAGLIEHCHYHLGQIVLLRKMIKGGKN